MWKKDGMKAWNLLEKFTFAMKEAFHFLPEFPKLPQIPPESCRQCKQTWTVPNKEFHCAAGAELIFAHVVPAAKHSFFFFARPWTQLSLSAAASQNSSSEPAFRSFLHLPAGIPGCSFKPFQPKVAVEHWGGSESSWPQESRGLAYFSLVPLLGETWTELENK